MSHHEPPPCTDEDCHRRACREARQLVQRVEPVDSGPGPEPQQITTSTRDQRRRWARVPRPRRIAPHPLAQR